MVYGLESEEVTIQELSKSINKIIEQCGLFIDEEDPRFGATPDGLINLNGIVEVKNPWKARDMTITEAMEKFSDLRVIDPKNRKNENNYTLVLSNSGSIAYYTT